jgi:anti-sigma factor RsiW
MNDHPEELLAGYTEGSLGADERARVEAHLATCDACQEEVDLAAEGLTTLSSLPELEPPRGIPFRVRRRAAGTPSRAWRFAGAAAAAAVLIGGGVFVFTNLDPAPLEGEGSAQQGAEPESAPRTGSAEGGGAGEQEAGVEAADAQLTAAPVLPIYVESRRNYESDDLAPLARGLRDDANDAVRSGLAPTARSFFEDFDPSAYTPDVRRAVRCVLADVPPQQLIVPYRIEAASFEAAPAYVATFLQGPTPDDPYDRLVMWVAHRETCGLMSLASQIL